VEALAAQLNESRLEELSLINGSIDDRGAAVLAAVRGLGGLTWLRLNGNHITADGLMALLTAASMPNLRRLILCRNRIATVSLEALGTVMERNPRLYVSLEGCPLTRQAQEDLSRRFPKRVGIDKPVAPKRRSRVSG
jgi:hypothetical protein